MALSTEEAREALDALVELTPSPHLLAIAVTHLEVCDIALLLGLAAGRLHHARTRLAELHAMLEPLGGGK